MLTESNIDVFMDQFRIQSFSQTVQVNNFYPFGLTFDSYSSGTQNNYLFNQGTGEKTFAVERQPELGVDFTKFRVYDPALGRFWQVDPKADMEGQDSWTPYHYGFNNPVRYNDPFGDCIPCLTMNLTAKYSTLMASMKSSSLQESVVRLMTSNSNTIQQRAGINSPATPVDTKAMAIMGDVQVVTENVSKNVKILTNEISKDGLAAAKVVGTGLEVTGVATPLGAAINTTATALDEGRQVAFEGKSMAVAGADFAVAFAIDATFSGLGNTAKSTVKQSEVGKEAFDRAVDAHSFGFSNLFQWVADKIRGNYDK